MLDYFEDTISALDYEDLLIFLRVNAKIMGIYVKGFDKLYREDYYFNIKNEEVFTLVKNEVEILEELVLKRLNSL